MAQVSKAFRCNLGRLAEHEALHIQTFAATTMALSAVFRSDRGLTVLVALKDNARSSQSFSRTLRCAFKRMGVTTSGLRGQWCTLLTESEVFAICRGGLDLPTSACDPNRAAACDAQSRRASVERSDDKIIPLG